MAQGKQTLPPDMIKRAKSNRSQVFYGTTILKKYAKFIGNTCEEIHF